MISKFSQVNINGLTDLTKMALSRYMSSQELDVVCLSETKTQHLPVGTLSNMNHIIKPNRKPQTVKCGHCCQK